MFVMFLTAGETIFMQFEEFLTADNVKLKTIFDSWFLWDRDEVIERLLLSACGWFDRDLFRARFIG